MWMQDQAVSSALFHIPEHVVLLTTPYFQLVSSGEIAPGLRGRTTYHVREYRENVLLRWSILLQMHTTL